jgi:hypothetical protein
VTDVPKVIAEPETDEEEGSKNDRRKEDEDKLETPVPDNVPRARFDRCDRHMEGNVVERGLFSLLRLGQPRDPDSQKLSD